LFVFGSPASNDWRGRDLVEVRPTITLRGARYTGHGRNVLGDPRVALAWLANELRELGVTLKTGEFVSTGTCHVPLVVQAGDELVLDLGGSMGRVSAKFV
jgi:2-keto-4-pentenoate hydratase